MVTTDEELAELLLPPTVRHHIGLVHPELCAKLVVEAYRIGYKVGREGRERAVFKVKASSMYGIASKSFDAAFELGKDLSSKELKRKKAKKQ